jgi:NADH-quinone oxidoreductase subunit G
VIAGPRLAEGAGGVDAARAVAVATGAKFAFVSRRANDRGALRAGVHPGLLPGGRRLGVEEHRGEIEAVWGAPAAPTTPGRDWRGILEACAAREIEVLYLLGVDPITDYPDAALAQRALRNVPHVVVQSLELGSLEPFADAFLPSAGFLEKDGHVTTWEGRSQRLRPVRGPLGISRPDWEILAGLAKAAGGDMGFETLDELHDEMGGLYATQPAPSQVSAALPGDGPPGVPEGSLVLFTYPQLVDEGRLSERADELKATLEDDPFVELHPDDAAALELTDGAGARIRTDAGEATLPVRVSPNIAKGAAFVPYNQPGFAANTLLSGSFRTTAVVESAELQPADAAAGGEA